MTILDANKYFFLEQSLVFIRVLRGCPPMPNSTYHLVCSPYFIPFAISIRFFFLKRMFQASASSLSLWSPREGTDLLVGSVWVKIGNAQWYDLTGIQRHSHNTRHTIMQLHEQVFVVAGKFKVTEMRRYDSVISGVHFARFGRETCHPVSQTGTITRGNVNPPHVWKSDQRTIARPCKRGNPGD